MLRRLTRAQAVFEFLKRQHVCRDGRQHHTCNEVAVFVVLCERYIEERYYYQSDAGHLAGSHAAPKYSSGAFSKELAVGGSGKAEGGMVAMRNLLGLQNPHTTVFCYNGMMALGALRCIHDERLQVPREISLVGFDDLFVASYTQPRLTTVRQPRRRLGQLAMESLLKLMLGQDSVDSISVPAELIVRESTAPPHEALE